MGRAGQIHTRLEGGARLGCLGSQGTEAECDRGKARGCSQIGVATVGSSRVGDLDHEGAGLSKGRVGILVDGVGCSPTGGGARLWKAGGARAVTGSGPSGWAGPRLPPVPSGRLLGSKWRFRAFCSSCVARG